MSAVVLDSGMDEESGVSHRSAETSTLYTPVTGQNCNENIPANATEEASPINSSSGSSQAWTATSRRARTALYAVLATVAARASSFKLVASRPPMDSDGFRKQHWCGGRARAALRLVMSTASFALTCFAAALAILITFWALFPVCTACMPTYSGAGTDAVRNALVPGETGRSSLYINQLQMIGTHNSYHRRTYVPAAGGFWSYHYPSLTAQLDAGVRHLELDIHFDWKTGRWFVFHLSVLDPVSTCNCLLVCLEEIKKWSDKHPNHHILIIEIELKLYGDFLRICGAKTPDTDNSAFLTMQSTVLDIFPRDKILTPREVKGDFETLTDAVRLTTVTAPKETADDRNGDLDGPLFSQWGRRHSAEEGPDGPGEGSSSSLNGLNSDPFAGPGYRDVSTAPGASTVPNGISDSSDISGGGEGLSSGSGSGIHDSTHSGVAANLAGVTEGLGRGEGVVGGWPLVDETRGMALFVIDYQSQNVACRPAVRKALPEDDTIFFERIPLGELEESTLAAFVEINPDYVDTILDYVQRGLFVRERMSKREWTESVAAVEDKTGASADGEGEVLRLYTADTPAQLLVSDDLLPLQQAAAAAAARHDRQESADEEPTAPLPCRSRCSTIVPEEECDMEGFC